MYDGPDVLRYDWDNFFDQITKTTQEAWTKTMNTDLKKRLDLFW